jgi:pyruvate dehydrogenase phosphatase
MSLDGNSPNEDTLAAKQLTNVKGFYLGVFDGHGGWQVSKLLKDKLHTYLDEALKGAKTEDQIKQAILAAHAKVESEWKDFASKGFAYGFPESAYVGSCALTAVIVEDKLYVANAGDSKALLLRQNTDKIEQVNVSTTFNAGKKEEQYRLKKQFPKEFDVYVCKKGDPKACYVKGSIMPTRAIGDLRLKDRDFNFH